LPRTGQYSVAVDTWLAPLCLDATNENDAGLIHFQIIKSAITDKSTERAAETAVYAAKCLAICRQGLRGSPRLPSEQDHAVELRTIHRHEASTSENGETE